MQGRRTRVLWQFMILLPLLNFQIKNSMYLVKEDQPLKLEKCLWWTVYGLHVRRWMLTVTENSKIGSRLTNFQSTNAFNPSPVNHRKLRDQHHTQSLVVFEQNLDRWPRYRVASGWMSHRKSVETASASNVVKCSFSWIPKAGKVGKNEIWKSKP